MEGTRQWPASVGFDLCPSANPATAIACQRAGPRTYGGPPTPLLWSYAHVYNLTRELAGEADMLSARYEADPRVKGSQADMYVVFEFRRLPS